MARKVTTLFFLFFSPIILFGQENQIMLTLNTRKGTETKCVSPNTKELIFEKSYIESIQGLDQLCELEKIIFDMTAFITNFSFLRDSKNLREVAFVEVHPESWTFIENLVNLEIIYIRSCRTPNMRLDLSKNTKLKYLEISNGSLDTYPELIHIPSSLEYLNLSYDNIQFIPEDKKQENNFVTILFRNRIEYYESKSFLFNDPKDILPSKYIITNVSH
jgi:Leucine-rich repeat (LRR) protein